MLRVQRLLRWEGLSWPGLQPGAAVVAGGVGRGSSGEDGPCVGGGGGEAALVDGVGTRDETLFLVKFLVTGLVERGLVVLGEEGRRRRREGRGGGSERKEMTSRIM